MSAEFRSLYVAVTVTEPPSAATIRPVLLPCVTVSISSGAILSSVIVTVRSDAEPATALVISPRVMTTSSIPSASLSAVTVMVTIPVVPSLITIDSAIEKSSSVAEPLIIKGTVTGYSAAEPLNCTLTSTLAPSTVTDE